MLDTKETAVFQGPDKRLLNPALWTVLPAVIANLTPSEPKLLTAGAFNTPDISPPSIPFQQKGISKFDNWNAESLIAKVSHAAYHSPQALETLLRADFYHFAAEYARGQLVTEISMEIVRGQGLFGMDLSYKESLAGQGSLFIQKMRQEQKQVTRAEIEHQNMQQLNDWSLAAPVGSLFIWSSPPGTKAEGYGGGEKSHSFTFIYQKVSNAEVKFHQFRTWMRREDHQAFLQQFSSHQQTLTSHQIIANTVQLNPPADMNPLAWSNTKIGALQTSLYATQEKWPVNPSEMPVVDEAEYAQFRDFLATIYIRKVVPLLLQQVPEVNNPLDPTWLAFIESPQYEQLVTQLDVAFALLAYQPLKKYVEVVDQRPKSAVTLISGLLKKLFNKNGSTSLYEELAPEKLTTIEQELLRIYGIQLKKEFGQKLSRQEVKLFNGSAGGLLSSANNMLSAGQCGLGQMISQSMSLNTQAFQAGMNFSPGTMGSLLEMKAGSLTSFQIKELKSHLESLTPIFVKNRDTSQTETWYVRFISTNPADIAAYQQRCYLKNNQLFGPCDEPLTPGAVPITFIDEQIDMFSLIPESEYLRQLALVDAKVTDDTNEVAPNTTLEDYVLSKISGELKQERAKELVKLAKEHLRYSVSLTQAMNGDTLHATGHLALTQLSLLSQTNKAHLLQLLFKEHHIDQPTATV